MKKSIIAMLSITALAGVANADNWTNKVDFSVGENSPYYNGAVLSTNTYLVDFQLDPYWLWGSDDAAANSTAVVTNKADAVNDLYLSIADTSGDRLYRSITDLQTDAETGGREFQPVAVGSGIYFDSLVQFTVTEDDAPSLSSEDKLVVWLKDNGSTTGETNLVITAGYVDDAGIVASKDYVIATSEASIEPGTWYRLTIDAIPLIDGADQNYGYLGFRVRVNGGDYISTSEGKMDGTAEECVGQMASSGSAIAVTAEDMLTLFPSRVSGGTGSGNSDSLSCVGFQGTGAVDDIAFTNVDPFKSEEPPAGNPTVGGQTVEPANVFNTAASNKPISYPTAPVLDGTEGVNQTITYNAVIVNVPTYYTATLTGTTVSLALNDNAVPAMGYTAEAEEQEEVPAMEVTENKVGVGVTTTNTKLWYGLASCNTPNGSYVDPAPAKLKQGTGKAMQLTADKNSDDSVKFYKIYVTDVAPQN